MVYSIIFNEVVKGQLESWLDSNEFQTMEEANEHGARMANKWWDKGRETVSWMTFYHSMRWTAETHYK